MITVLVFSRETELRGGEKQRESEKNRERDREISFKELAHAIGEV